MSVMISQFIGSALEKIAFKSLSKYNQNLLPANHLFPKQVGRTLFFALTKGPRQVEVASRKREVQNYTIMHWFLKALPRSNSSHFCSIMSTQNCMGTGRCNSTVGLEREAEMLGQKQQGILFKVINKLNLKGFYLKVTLLNVYGRLKQQIAFTLGN